MNADQFSERDDQSSARARHLYDAGQYDDALQLLRALADSASARPWILSLVGTMHLKGQGTRVDQDEAVRWYRRAADMGDPGALTFLAALKRQEGRYGEARAMLDRAIEQDYGQAYIELGYLHDRGLGVERDRRRARDYFEAAARKGLPYGKRLLAQQLLRGDDGVTGVLRGLWIFGIGLVQYVAWRLRHRR
jgi:uncharacterized protein